MFGLTAYHSYGFVGTDSGTHPSVHTNYRSGRAWEFTDTKLTAEQEQFVPFSSWLQELEWLDDFVVSGDHDYGWPATLDYHKYFFFLAKIISIQYIK